MKKTILVSLITFLSLMAIGQETWKPTTGEISAKIKNAGVTVTARFSGFKGSLVFGPENLSSSSLAGTVEVATIKTGINKRDEDLKEEKYFNADKYKTIEIKSLKLYKKGAQYAGMFNVTIKGVTKQAEIPFEFTQHGNEAEFKGNFTIHRSDFGIGGKTLTMSDDADVEIDVKASK